ncbi:restriction endonuclease subunit S [Psychrobacter arenosus]|uniref:restriction endonuclease subunit S n=1 Tax=Psychrobacter arenosus TaxID=256326 RepID=UPI001917F3F5|nr:restriction endonuclease subunit S [Psychrobacter arenosus]
MMNEESLSGWEKTTLGNIADYINGRAFKPTEWQSTGIPIIRIQNLNKPTASYNYYQGELEEKYKVKNGDLLYSWSASLDSYIWSEEDAYLNQHIFNVKPYGGIRKKFIYYLLKQISSEILTKTHGMGMIHITKGNFEKIEVLIPPLNEQDRIIDKIEVLYSEVDTGIANLTLAKRQLEQYRQSLLKHAFEGKLTAEWRSDYEKIQGKPLPTADGLLEQVQNARQAYYDQQIADWEQSVEAWEEKGKEGSKPRKPSALKKLESIADLNEINLPKLPSSWLWERLGLMTLSVEYGTSTKSEKQGLVPVLRMGNMQNGIIDWDDLVFTSDTDEIEKYALKKGDVLFNRTNSPELVGKTSIILSDTKAIFAGYLIRVNQLDCIVYSKYLNYFLGSHIAKQYGNFVKTDGVNQSNINGQKLMNYPFPYCSLDEQVLIVAELDKKIGTADKFKDDIESAIKKLANLKTSILHKAFQGKLVPQDPNDPPASELLAQIKAEREAKALAEQQAKQAKAKSKSKTKSATTAKKPKKPKKDEQITLPL